MLVCPIRIQHEQLIWILEHEVKTALVRYKKQQSNRTGVPSCHRAASGVHPTPDMHHSPNRRDVINIRSALQSTSSSSSDTGMLLSFSRWRFFFHGRAVRCAVAVCGSVRFFRIAPHRMYDFALDKNRTAPHRAAPYIGF